MAERKRTREETADDVSTVQGFYNSRRNTTTSERQQSLIIQMKSFNNWVKAVLISKYVQPGFCCLDICGGKGGDLLKWATGRIGHLVLADHAEGSVRDALERYNKLRERPFSATFIAADCFQTNICEPLPPQMGFDLVSCQFALHYSFQTEQRARGFLQNVSQRMKPGAHFLATFPNADVLVKRLMASPSLKFGNSVYSIEFDSKDSLPKFGARYHFYLEDAVDSPEYLVHVPTLDKLAQEYGLKLASYRTFPEFFERFKGDYDELRNRMKVPADYRDISKDEWEAISLYSVCVFQKAGQPQPFRPVSFGGPKILPDSAVIVLKTPPSAVEATPTEASDTKLEEDEQPRKKLQTEEPSTSAEQ